MTAVARYPDSTKASLEQRLRARARERWPQIASLHIRHRGNFSYVDATLADGTMLKLCRLRYVGSASQWQFAIYRASHDDYDESVFPPACPSAPVKTPSTPPAASISTTPLPGSNPRRTYGRHHLVHRSITGEDDVVDMRTGKAVRAGVVLEGGDHPLLGLDRREPGQARVLHELKYRVVR